MDRIRKALDKTLIKCEEIEGRLYLYTPLYPNYSVNTSIIQKLILNFSGSTVHVYGGQGYYLQNYEFNINSTTSDIQIVNAITTLIGLLQPEHKEHKNSVLIIDRSKIA